MGLSPDAVKDFPRVRLFFEGRGETARGTHETHLLISNGAQLLCADDSGYAFLASLKDIVRVSACNDDRFHCTYDFGQGRITYRDRRTGRSAETGPLRGAPDPSINVRRFAETLGLKWDAVCAAPLPPFNAPHCDGFVASAGAGVTGEAVTIDSIVGAVELDDLEAFAVPDLLSMEVEPEVILPFKPKSPPHRGRVDPTPTDEY